MSGKTELRRKWGESIFVDPAWNNFGHIAPDRAYFYWVDAKEYPTDKKGFRIPDGYASVAEKYSKAAARPRIFCFGGSTTFCDYISSSETWPAWLERHSGLPVFNFGLRTFDLHAELYTFIDVLRMGLVPEAVVFLDGVNEKGGYLKSQEGCDTYECNFIQYEGFLQLVRSASLKRRLRKWLLDLLGVSKAHEEENKIDNFDPLKFSKDQANNYLTCKHLIEKICFAYGIKSFFFLQPSVWNCWPTNLPKTNYDNVKGEQKGPVRLWGYDERRFSYLKDVYKNILEKDETVHDISDAGYLEAESFLDFFHLDEEGNKRIAREILDVIKPACHEETSKS